MTKKQLGVILGVVGGIIVFVVMGIFLGKSPDSTTPTYEPTPNIIPTAFAITTTPGSRGSWQIATALPKLEFPDLSDLELFRKILHDKWATWGVNYLEVARGEFWGIGTACQGGFIRNLFKPIPNNQNMSSYDLWKNEYMYYVGVGIDSCKTAVIKADMIAGIPVKILLAAIEANISIHPYKVETDAQINYVSNITIEVTVEVGFDGPIVYPGNIWIYETIAPNPMAMETLDANMYINSWGEVKDYSWRSYTGLDAIAVQNALADTVGEINYTTWTMSPDNLERLFDAAKVSTAPGGQSYETIKSLICSAAVEAGYAEVGALPACEVKINLTNSEAYIDSLGENERKMLDSTGLIAINRWNVYPIFLETKTVFGEDWEEGVLQKYQNIYSNQP